MMTDKPYLDPVCHNVGKQSVKTLRNLYSQSGFQNKILDYRMQTKNNMYAATLSTNVRQSLNCLKEIFDVFFTFLGSH